MNGEKHWLVSYFEMVRQRVAALLKRAVQLGNQDDVVKAIKTIDHILRTRPDTFGEEKYRLPALQLQARIGCQRPLVVRYSVHEVQPLVFVTAIEPLPRSGLD